MNENRVQKYKLAKKISNQIEYLENKGSILKLEGKYILLQFSYI